MDPLALDFVAEEGGWQPVGQTVFVNHLGNHSLTWSAVADQNWIVLGSVLFFGAIVATVTAYFMRPMQRPHKKIIDAIEYNLEQLDDLSIDELNLLKETVDTLIAHVEHLKERQTGK